MNDFIHMLGFHTYSINVLSQIRWILAYLYVHPSYHTINLLKISPEYIRAGVYGKCVL